MCEVECDQYARLRGWNSAVGEIFRARPERPREQPNLLYRVFSRRVKHRGVALTANSLLAPGSSIRAIILPHPSAFLAYDGRAFTFTLTYRVRVKQDYELRSNCNLLAVLSPTLLFFPQLHFLQMAFLTPKFCSASSTQRSDCR
jgi:hypothetical protein